MHNKSLNVWFSSLAVLRVCLLVCLVLERIQTGRKRRISIKIIVCMHDCQMRDLIKTLRQNIFLCFDIKRLKKIL